MAESGAAPDAGEEAALRALEDRLARVTERAERLLAQAAVGQVPRSGWRAPGAAGEASAQEWVAGEDAHVLLGLLSGLAEWVPPELQERLAAAVREVLLALRALIDWCLERAERRRGTPTEVQDIPIL